MAQCKRFYQRTLSAKCDGFCDTVSVLCDESDAVPIYCGHPNADGCAAWAKALIPIVKKL